MSSQNLSLYLTTEHECGYLPGYTAMNLVPDPCVPMSMDLYGQLIELGYRRSGAHAYRPHCRSCRQCLPCRVDISRFRPNRSQRRCLQTNRDCTSHRLRATYIDEHFQLYRRYINARHAGGNMANPLPQDFENFLYSDWSDTSFLEIREDGRLLAVAVYDQTRSGLSAVYSYFNPDMNQRSLGTYCLLKTIELTGQLGLDYVYLGYLIDDCGKMRYKQNFRPLQVYRDNQWQDYAGSGPTVAL
jgi:arginyl-tRNA--protein-N-Asp/Glu arginylyltransferase